MDVFVFGIGCSGTTMTYSLLQGIYTRLYRAEYFSTYEPFIWNKEKFNRPYEEAGSLFGRTGSLSIEGIYHHLNTPMFIDSASSEDFVDKAFFRHLSSTHGPGKPHLAKFIRGNGRLPLFRALNPQAMFLLMIRNPVDNINCAKHKFSFYGEDFYPSDYQRFHEQLDKENKLVLEGGNHLWAQKQAEYCYQMNRAAVDFAILDPNTMVLEYDNFVRNRASCVARICAFLDIPFEADFMGTLNQPTGPVTTSRSLSQSEYETILAYDELYSGICDRAGVVRGKSKAAVQAQYDGVCDGAEFDFEHEESTTNRLRRVIRAREKQVQHLEKQLEHMKYNSQNEK